MMSPRKFLGWSQSPLVTAAAQLCESYRHLTAIDFTNAILVVSGGRAARTLLEQIVRYAEAMNLPLFPPRIVTPGQLPEMIYSQRKPFALPLVQQMTWSYALRQHRHVATHIPHHPPADDTLGWFEFARQIALQFEAITAEAKDFHDVAKLYTKDKKGPDAKRWKFLSEVQDTYLSQLEQMGLVDRNHARLDAIRRRACRTDREWVLVALADMDGVVREMVQQIRPRVTVLVAAPELLHDHFDDLGTVIPDAWINHPCSVSDAQITLVDGPRDQANAVVSQLEEWADRYSVSEVAIAVPDAELVGELQRQLLECGIENRWWMRRRMKETGPWRLLEVVSRYLQDPTYTDFANLIRHPDVAARWCTDAASAEILRQADHYQMQHLPPQVGIWLGPAQERTQVERIHEQLESAFEVLRLPAAKMATWADRIASFVTHVYGERTLNLARAEDSDLAETLARIAELCTDLRRAPAHLDAPTHGANAIQVLLRLLEQEPIVAEEKPDCLELVGWLDAPLDPVAATLVTSFHDGIVPAAGPSDPFLSESLRAKLGIANTPRRIARDAYHFELLLQSRQETRVVIAKRDSVGNPCVPSRLVLLGDDATLTRRSCQLFDEVPITPTWLDRLAPDSPAPLSSPLVVPPPMPGEPPIADMNVTSFRDYLNCPYRFYLRHVLGLKSSQDHWEELPPNLFGTMMHDVLQRFGEGSLKSSGDPSAIREFLIDTLSEYAHLHFGPMRLPAVEIQLQIIEHRLEAFANWQARRAREGWQIHFVETKMSKEVCQLQLANGGVMGIRGRIDRIDWHPDTDEWQVLDYKTSDKGKSPDEVHRKKQQWIDLQLPLYHFMAPHLGIPQESLRLGFVLLPKDLTKVSHVLADWNEEDLRMAYATAQTVAGCVQQGIFWPPADKPAFDPPEFAALCAQRRAEVTL